MKKISNEVKVGATALLTIIVFIWLYNFLKGKRLFSKYQHIIILFMIKLEDLLNQVLLKLTDTRSELSSQLILLMLQAANFLLHSQSSKDFKLPENTVAEIVPVSLLGGMKVQFVYGNGPGTYSEGDTIPGRLAESIIDKVETEFIPVKDKISNLIVVLDSVISSVNEVMNADFKKNLGGTIANLNSTTGSLDKIIGSKEKELKVNT